MLQTKRKIQVPRLPAISLIRSTRKKVVKTHKSRADKVQANIRSNSKITERTVTEKKEAENMRRL